MVRTRRDNILSGLGALLLVCAMDAPLAAAHDHEGRSSADSCRVTVWMKRSTLSELLERVSLDTGARLGATQAVGDHRVTVFAKNMPLGDLREAIAQTFGLVWLQGGGRGRYDHILVEGRNRALRARALRDAPVALTQSGLARTIGQCLEGEVPPHLIEGVRAEDVPRLREETRGRAEVLSILSPTEVDSLLRGGRLRTLVADMVGDPRAVVERFVREHAMRGWSEEDIAQAYIEFVSEGYQPALTGTDMVDLGFVIGTATGGPSSGYNMVVEPVAYGKELKRRVDALRAGERQSTEAQRATAPPGQLDARLASARKEDSLGGRKDGPAPRRLRGLADVLEDIASLAHVDIVSDCHIKPPQLVDDVSGLKLHEALSKTASAFGQYWKTTGKAYLFRSERWWEDDAAEVPERVIRRWRHALATQGYLPLAVLAEIAALGEAQFGRLLLVMPDADVLGRPRLGPGSAMAPREGTLRGFLRFYGALPARHRAVAETNDGLPCWSLAEGELAALAEATEGRAPESRSGPAVGPEALADCVFSVRTEVSTVGCIHALRLQRNAGSLWTHHAKQLIRKGSDGKREPASGTGVGAR